MVVMSLAALYGICGHAMQTYISNICSYRLMKAVSSYQLEMINTQQTCTIESRDQDIYCIIISDVEAMMARECHGYLLRPQ